MKALLLVSELEDYTISFASGVAQHLDVVLAVPRRRYAHLASSLPANRTCSGGRAIVCARRAACHGSVLM